MVIPYIMKTKTNEAQAAGHYVFITELRPRHPNNVLSKVYTAPITSLLNKLIWLGGPLGQGLRNLTYVLTKTDFLFIPVEDTEFLSEN